MTRPDPTILAAVRASNLPRLMAIAEHVYTILNPQGRKDRPANGGAK